MPGQEATGARWPLKELAFVWGGNILSKVMMFAATVYLANALEVEGFGVFSTAFAVVNYVSLALFTGLDTLSTRESAALVPENTWAFSKKLFSYRRRIVNLAVIITALFALFMGKGHKELGFALIIFGLSFLPQQIYAVNLFYGLEWPAPVAAYFVGGRIFYLTLLFLTVKGPEDLYFAAGAFTLAIALENIFLFLCLFRRYNRRSDPKVSAPEIDLKPVLLLTGLSALLLLHENAPQFLVFFLKGDEEAGLYASSFRLIYTAVTFANLGGFVFLARFSRQQKENVELAKSSYKKARLFALILGILLALAGYFGADLIYGLLFKASYREGAAVMRAGVFQMALVPVRVLAWQYALVRQRAGRLLLPMIIGVSASIGITLCLILSKGALGAAGGLVCGELAICSLLLWIAR